MIWLALRMLTGDRSKYFGLVFSISFASMLMAHQASIFWGLMRRTTSQIQDVEEPDVWVMDPKTTNIDDQKPLRDADVLRVRGVPGVAWAVGLFRGQVRLKLAAGDFRSSILLGVDDTTLVGAPREMLLGDAFALREPEAIVLDKAGYEYLWPGEPLALGRVLELNDRRVEPAVLPKRTLSGVSTERLDTRILQVVYRIEGSREAAAPASVYVGQQVDVFIDEAR